MLWSIDSCPKRYPLTSVTWLYRELRYSTYWGDVFFKVIRWTVFGFKVKFSLLSAYSKSWVTWERYFLTDPSEASFLAFAKAIYYDTFSKTTLKGIQLWICSLGFLLSLESSHSYSLERLMFAKEAPTGIPCLCITSVTTSFTSGWYESKSNTLRTTFAKPSLGKACKRKLNCIAVGLFQTKTILVKINVTVVLFVSKNIKFAGTPLQIDIKINLPCAQMEISVEKILNCADSKNRYWGVLSDGNVYHFVTKLM